MSKKKKRTIPLKDNHRDDVQNLSTVASTTECTGLIPVPPEDEQGAESYRDLYNIPKPDIEDFYKEE